MQLVDLEKVTFFTQAKTCTKKQNAVKIKKGQQRQLLTLNNNALFDGNRKGNFKTRPFDNYRGFTTTSAPFQA